MKVVAIIPARYNSSRFKGKPLVDILGKPMIVRVYERVKKSKKIDEVYVATDDKRIYEACINNNLKVVMTGEHNTSTERVNEVAHQIEADVYVCINGDEPLVETEIIDKVIPDTISDELFVCNLITKIDAPSEVVDFTNIKVVFDKDDMALFYSRSPIPYPKGFLEYDYYKHLGILSYNKKALEFFANTARGYNERIEDINELRFLENGVGIKLVKVEANSLSVDTPKDLDKVIMVMKEKNLR